MSGDIDAMAPFLVGAAEGMLVATITGDTDEFLFMAMLTWGTGIFASLNYRIQARRSRMALSRQSWTLLKGHPQSNSILISSGFVFTAALWAYWVFVPAQPASWVMSWLAAATVLLFLLSNIPRWNRPMRQPS
ncbi:hypothetical protein Rhe02_78460 [Rhizocola hellebori]|uniref:Uncharacterized protein n=1 Tax=Rhizocola hellebori TaxID=1392758 RepID=A0A8J3QF87_9ACTN|nr:hypothetical protein [Rhizocola hellebori]GIH09779.1 hypothetical protein Rhe02_78460 [Rhizocola hellebori]